MKSNYLQNMFSLEGKTALVTGAGRGIGQVICRELARAGADIAIFSRSGASETVKLIESEGGKALDIIADVTKEDQVAAGIRKIMDTWHHLDIVVNNAGVCYHKDAFEASVEEWRECLDINLTGEYIVCREAARVMIENGIHGSMVNIASVSGHIVNIPQCQAAYNASKAGVIHMSKSLAIEWIDKGIRVNSLSPGYVATPMSVDPDFVEPELMAAWQPLFPMHRMAKPEELCGAIIWLCSESAGYTTGADIIIDGAYGVV
ncbi:MAG TPA: SDR family oxidoreductase [Candidatus Mediterraneibacter colneyensis]|nr:SDR family oxidoreductase [Candidatus Mediterraneibacter colneyensis]